MFFLYGMSFGGGNAVRQAELYPGTFNGYISHDGVISREMGRKSERVYRLAYKSWLDPAQLSEMDKIKDRLLILHNKDDGNVFKGILRLYSAVSR